MDILDLQPALPRRLVRGRHGLFLVNENDCYIGQSLLQYGEYSELEMQTLAQLCRPGKDVIEVGANIGSLSVPLAKRLRELERQLLVIEPVPVTFQNLCANLSLNGLQNVITKNIACSESNGECFFSPINFDATGNFGAVEVSAQRNEQSWLSVPCMRLDQVVPAHFDVGLIKIDTEGYELAVLQGATGLIDRFRPVLYLENDRRDQSPVLIDWLWQAGYELWWDFMPLFNPENWSGKVDDIFVKKNVFSQNMIAVPVEHSAQVERRKVLSLNDWCFSE